MIKNGPLCEKKSLYIISLFKISFENAKYAEQSESKFKNNFDVKVIDINKTKKEYDKFLIFVIYKFSTMLLDNAIIVP